MAKTRYLHPILLMALLGLWLSAWCSLSPAAHEVFQTADIYGGGCGETCQSGGGCNEGKPCAHSCDGQGNGAICGDVSESTSWYCEEGPASAYCGPQDSQPNNNYDDCHCQDMHCEQKVSSGGVCNVSTECKTYPE